MGWTLPGQCMCIPWDVVFCTCRNMRCMLIGGFTLFSCAGIWGDEIKSIRRWDLVWRVKKIF